MKARCLNASIVIKSLFDVKRWREEMERLLYLDCQECSEKLGVVAFGASKRPIGDMCG